jgi:hypothetical protein
MRRLELDILYWSTRAAILFLLPPFISDLSLYRDYAHKLLLEGQIPYRNWDFEYPPLAYPLMLLPSLFQRWLGFTSLESYRALFGLLLLPMDYFLFRRFRASPPFRGAAFAYVLLTSSMCLLLFDRFDLVVGFLVALPFLLPAGDGKFILSWGLGGALKLVPLGLAPFPPFGWRPFRFLRFLAYGALISLPLLLSCAAAALLSGGKISFLSHHSSRGVQVESLVGSLLMAAQAFFGLVNTSVQTNFGAQHIGEIPGVVEASRVLFYGTLAFSYFFLWWERKRRDELVGSWILLLGFVAFGYVLSPQFMLWLIPLGLCAAGRVRPDRRALWLGVFSLAVVATGAHFRHYWSYVNLNHLSVAAVLGRNVSLALLWALSWRWMRSPEADFSLENSGLNEGAASGSPAGSSAP